MHSYLQIRQLACTDIDLMRGLNVLFGEAFGERDTYGAQPPSDLYLQGLLAKEHVIVLVAPH